MKFPIQRTIFALLTISPIYNASPILAQTISTEQLRQEIHQRLVSGHSPIGYSQTDEAMAEIDQDPNTPDNLILFYTGRSQDKDKWVSSNAQDGWNREHLWPQSRGTRAAPMKSDLHHLMPTDASVNQHRSNLNFDNGGSPEGEAPDTFLDDDSFEPRDDIKGDVARALFYMDVRYEGTNGEPDLNLVDELPVTGGTSIGDLCTLLSWHQSDPVSNAEKTRNDRIQTRQGNRNLFIDEPELANKIFGPECNAPVVTSASLIAATPATLRIGTWNIANLHHESGVPLRSGAVARDDQDYERLAGLANTLDLDVVALQEIGSPAAARRIFPEDKYHLVMSSSYEPGTENLPEEQRNIFTAMAFSKEAFKTPPKTESLSALAVPHIGFDRDGTASIRPTRAGLIAELTLAGEPVKIMGVHLKSFCHRWSLDPVTDQNPNNGNPFSSRFDCRTLKAQLSILESWIEQQADLGVTVVVLGDFNRDMNALNQQEQAVDDFWLDLNDGAPSGLTLIKGPLGKDTVCWPNHPGRHEDNIDFIVYGESLGDLAGLETPRKVSMGFESDPKYAGKEQQRLSDHCPVIMSVRP